MERWAAYDLRPQGAFRGKGLALRLSEAQGPTAAGDELAVASPSFIECKPTRHEGHQAVVIKGQDTMSSMQHTRLPVRSHDGTVWTPAKPAKPTKPARLSEGQIADRFVEAHHRRLGILVAGRGRRKAEWIIWTGEAWQADRLNVALRLAREVCRDAADECEEPQLDSLRTASAVLALAKADVRITVADWPPSPDIMDALDAWLAGPVELDPEGFISLASLRRTLPQACQWGRSEANAALEACGITYRLRGRREALTA